MNPHTGAALNADYVRLEKVGDLDLEIHSGPGNVRCDVTAVWRCLDCGALVGDRDTHKTWHARIDGSAS